MTPEAAPETAARRRAIRRNIRILFEIAVAFALLAAVDHGLNGGSGFANVRPSPYWLPVLVMALVYGTGPGALAALVASALWLVAADGDGADRDYLDTLLHLSIPPLLWGVAAVAIGEVTLLRKRRLAKAERRAGQATRDIARLTDAHERLTRTNLALQRRVAGDPRTIGHVVAMATRIAAVDAQARRTAIAELIALAAGSDDFTCYRLTPEGAHAWVRGRGVSGASLGRPEHLPPDMMRPLLTDPRIRHVARRSDRDWLAGLGVAAVPLGDMSGAICGLLLFHALPIGAYNAHRLAEWTEIAGWLGPMLAGPGQGTLHAIRTPGRAGAVAGAPAGRVA